MGKKEKELIGKYTINDKRYGVYADVEGLGSR
jgi:hypothetical protein